MKFKDCCLYCRVQLGNTQTVDDQAAIDEAQNIMSGAVNKQGPKTMTVEQKPYPFAQFEADEFDNIVDVFRRRGEDPEAGFAKMLTGTLSQEYPDDPDYISYDKLKDGTAGVFELFQNLLRNRQKKEGLQTVTYYSCSLMIWRVGQFNPEL